MGVPEAQAEAQAETMAEAFVFNMDALVTKDYLEQCLDVRFAAQDVRIDGRFADHDQRFNKVDLVLMEIHGDLKLQRWMLALIVVTTLIPVLPRWFTAFAFIS